MTLQRRIIFWGAALAGLLVKRNAGAYFRAAQTLWRGDT